LAAAPIIRLIPGSRRFRIEKFGYVLIYSRFGNPTPVIRDALKLVKPAEPHLEIAINLLANKREKEGESHADSDRPFRYINRTAKRFLKRKESVTSVDAKKKEKIGDFKNNGRNW
jgi:Rhodopirellula transposase DDE domain